MCQVSIFFPWSGFGDAGVQHFSFFSTWLPHHMTDDVIMIITAFYMSSHTYGENFLSIQQAIPEKRE